MSEKAKVDQAKTEPKRTTKLFALHARNSSLAEQTISIFLQLRVKPIHASETIRVRNY